ncbi:MAG: hypothetical protein AB1689_03025 [Thermodesulfobacteriota bacterium]
MPAGYGGARQRKLLFLGWIVPPVVWLAQLTVAYALAPWACAHGREWPLALVTGASAAVTAAVAGLLLAAWRRDGGTWREATNGGGASRETFAALVGFFVSVLVLLILLAQGLAIAIIEPCD